MGEYKIHRVCFENISLAILKIEKKIQCVDGRYPPSSHILKKICTMCAEKKITIT